MIMVGIVMPAVAVLLATGYVEPILVTQISVPDGWALRVVEGCGVLFYLTGHVLVSWARFSIGCSFQMAGMAPRPNDELMVSGAYALMRHPMYAALVCFNLGLTLLIQSVVVLLLSLAILVAIMRLIPIEETKLERAYGEKYIAYRQKVKALIPYVF
jgi:protein-S-isoprenylcysteine O-methyltransferase Ste14